MDAATRLALGRKIAGTIVHVSQKRARGALESYVAVTERSLSSASRSNGGKPFVASLVPWSTWHETVELAQWSLRFWGTRQPCGLCSTYAAPQMAN
jgi:hypothetical protein